MMACCSSSIARTRSDKLAHLSKQQSSMMMFRLPVPTTSRKVELCLAVLVLILMSMVQQDCFVMAFSTCRISPQNNFYRINVKTTGRTGVSYMVRIQGAQSESLTRTTTTTFASVKQRHRPRPKSLIELSLSTKSSSSHISTSKTNKQYSSSSSSSSSSFDPQYYVPLEQSAKNENNPARITLTRFLSQYVKDHPELHDLENILLAVQMACKTISNLVSRAGLVYSIQNNGDDINDNNTNDNKDDTTNNSRDYNTDGRFYSMKRLDKLSTTVLKNALKYTGTVQMIVPEAKDPIEQPDQHQPGVLIAYDEHNLACLDPLDGSGNADASICTGTVFGVFEKGKILSDKQQQKNKDGTDDNNDFDEDSLLEAVLQPGNKMKAAGYCLYSSATVLVFTLGSSVYGFTLDPQIQEFVLTHDKLTIPSRGNVYSCNEANSEGWQDEWKTYLKKIKLGEGETKERYALRYVGSMVGDIHRTLLYGGVFAYPSDRLQKPHGNLQLLYKSAPMSFVVHHAGGKAIDESGANLLDKRPERIHQKSPCFMGSPKDIEELQRYLKGLQ